MHLDVLDQTQIKDSLAGRRDFSHVYYFASPKISYNEGDFDENAYRLMLDYYRDGLLRVVNTLQSLTASPLVIFVPSTTYIDSKTPGFSEYIRAKVESEQALAALEKQNSELRVLIARLPKLESDQTRGLIPEEYPDTVQVLKSAFTDLAV